MSYMFACGDACDPGLFKKYDCTGAAHTCIPHFNTTAVTNMTRMFDQVNLVTDKTIKGEYDVLNFRLDNIVDMSFMFAHAWIALDISGWVVDSQSVNMLGAFYDTFYCEFWDSYKNFLPSTFEESVVCFD